MHFHVAPCILSKSSGKIDHPLFVHYCLYNLISYYNIQVYITVYIYNYIYVIIISIYTIIYIIIYIYYTDVCNLTRTPESWPHFSLKTVQNSSNPNHSHFPFEIHINSLKKSLFQSQSLGDSNSDFLVKKTSHNMWRWPSGAIVIRGTAVVSMRVTLASCGWKSYGQIWKILRKFGWTFPEEISSIWWGYFSLLSNGGWFFEVPAKSSFSETTT